ncbi:MAG TPA: cell division protein FtsA [Acidobacteriota bacterium]|nr:cell division protein FtsA [Acidobacteriota bacterium]
MAKKDRYIVGLDIGTTKVCVLVAEIRDDGALDIIGMGTSDSKGLRKGVIVNVDPTVECIKKVVEEAELMAGISIEEAFVGIAGEHIMGSNSRGMISINSRDHVISRDDINRVIEAAKQIPIPTDKDILHVLPQEFMVDGQDEIGDPLGMSGNRLEVNVHVVTCGTTQLQTLLTCVNKAGIEVADTVLEQLASSESVLTPDEKELGVALIDIGGGTTDLAIFEKQSLWHSYIRSIGGDHFTSDIAVGLRTPMGEAERIKKRYGCALGSMIEDEETIEVPSVAGRKPRYMSRQILCDIIQPRAEELFMIMKDEIDRMGLVRSLNSGVVLTGGGSLLEGMMEIAERIFDLPVRIGKPVGVGGLIDVINSPVYSTAVGLIIYGYRTREVRSGSSRLGGSRRKPLSRFKDWIAEIF